MKNFESMDWGFIIKKLGELATCSQTRELLEKTSPKTHQKEAVKSLETIEEARNILKQIPRPSMESLDFYQTWFYRLQKKATLQTLEIKDVRLFLTTAQNLKETLSGFNGPWVDSLKVHLISASGLLKKIHRVLTPQGRFAPNPLPFYKNFSQRKNNKKIKSKKF